MTERIIYFANIFKVCASSRLCTVIWNIHHPDIEDKQQKSDQGHQDIIATDMNQYVLLVMPSEVDEPRTLDYSSHKEDCAQADVPPVETN